MKKSIFLLFAVLTVCMFTVSCSQSSDGKTLYVYNWGEYIADGTEGSANVNELFEDYYYEKTGEKIEVNYSTFSSNEDMYAKIASGAVTYDVIVPSDYMIERLINEDLLEPIYPEQSMPNYEAIIDEYRNLPYDPDNIYSVPYAYGMIGIIYNTDMVNEDDEGIGSWDLMWDEKYAGEILQYNNSRDAFGTSFFSLGYVDMINSEDEKYWNEGLERLLEQKKYVQGYVMDEIFNKMESGSAAISAYYAGDYLTMYEEGDAPLEFYYPKEGTNYYVDAFCVPKCTKNKDLAIEYINFMLYGDIEIGGEEYNISVENAEMTYYASPNSNVFLDEDYFYDMEEIRPGTIAILYPDNIEEILEERELTYDEYLSENDLDERCIELWSKKPVNMYRNLSEDGLERLNVLWERLKIESSVGSGIYIICIVIVAVIVSITAVTLIRKKRRAVYYEYRPEE